MDRPASVRQQRGCTPAILRSWQVVVVLYLLIVGFAVAIEHHPDVLILHSYHKATWSDEIYDGIVSTINEERTCNYFVEYMDTKKLMTETYLDSLLSIYQQKYSDMQFDVVIATDDNAYQFALQHYDDLLKGVPLVFCGVNDFDPAQIEGLSVTGVLEQEQHAPTLSIAMKLFPDTQKVYIVCDHTISAEINLKILQRIIKNRFPHVQPEVLRDYTQEEMIARLGSLEDDSLVYSLGWWYDINGNVVLQDQLTDILCQSRRPVFATSVWQVTRGVIGGKCMIPFNQGAGAGKLALQILRNPDDPLPDVITDPRPFSRYVFDAELLDRYGVDLSALPKGARILNRPSAFYRISKQHMQLLVVGVIVLAAICGLLCMFVYYRMKIHRVVRESEQRYRGLVETTSDWIWEVDAEGISTFDSPQVEDAIGYRPEQVAGKKPFDFMPPDEASRVMSLYNQYVAAKKPVSHLQVNLIHKDGRPVIIETNGVPIFDAKGHLVGYRGINRVITERVETERTLRAQQAEIQSIFKASPVGIGFTINRTMMRVNDLICEMTGYSREELIGQNARMLYGSDEDYEYVGTEKYRQIQERGTGTVEVPWLRKDGTQIEVLLSSTPLDVNDLSKGVTFTAMDITERKRIMTELAESQRRISNLLNNLHSVAYRCTNTSEWPMEFISKPCKEMTGYTDAEFISHKVFWADLIHPDDRQNVWDRVQRSLSQKDPFRIEYRIIDKAGNEHWVWERGVGVYDEDGNVEALEGLIMDITDRKKAVAALHESEERLRVLFDQAADPILIINHDGRIVQVNKQACKNSGYSQEELLELYVTDLDEGLGSLEKLHEFWATLVPNQPVTFESHHRRKDGFLYPVEITASLLDISQGSFIMGIVRDITTRKQAEVDRIRTLKFNEALLNALPSPVFYKDTEGRYLGCNKAFEEYTGRSSEDIKGKTVYECWSSEDAKVYHEKDLELIQNPEYQRYEFQMQNKDGIERDVIFAKDAFYDELGQVAGIIGVFVDISERKEAEKALYEAGEALRANQRLTQMAMDNIPQFIFWKDINSVYQGCNKNFAKVAGVESPEAIIGKTDFDLAWKKEEAEFFRTCDRRVMDTRKAELHIIEPQLQADGKQAWLDTNKVPMFDDDGNVIGILGTYEDITERKEAEEMLRQRTLDLERFEKLAIGRELKMVELKQQIKSLQAKIRNTSGRIDG